MPRWQWRVIESLQAAPLMTLGQSPQQYKRSAAGSAFYGDQTLQLRASHAPRTEVTPHRGKMAPSLWRREGAGRESRDLARPGPDRPRHALGVPQPSERRPCPATGVLAGPG